MKKSKIKDVHKYKVDIKVVIIIVLFAIVGTHFLFQSHAASTSLSPIADISDTDSVAVGKSTSDFYKDVSDGTAFSSADDNTSYI